jgi:hypothetical protein
MAAGVTIQHKRKASDFVGGELEAGEMGLNTDSGVWFYSTDGTTVNSIVSGGGQIVRAAGTTVEAGDYLTWLVLAADSANITGTTFVVVMTITSVGVGRYHFKCQLIYQATAVSTGLNVAVNFTGTLTQFACEARFVSTGSTATTKAASQAAQATTLGMYEAEGTRLTNTAIGSLSNFIISVDASNSDMILTIEGFMVVSVAGDLEIKISAELASLVVRAMQGSHLELMKLS